MRVAVLGAGYAGLTVARRLERRLPEEVELVVVDEAADHLVQHELHRVIRFPDLADTLTVPLEDVLERATVRRARVTDVDTDAGVATLAPLESPDADDSPEARDAEGSADPVADRDDAGSGDGTDPLPDDREELHYDAAAVCLGAETAFHDLPGVEAHATPLKRLGHAESIRAAALDAAGGDVVVGGAGLSGIQAAGELAQLARDDGLDLDVTLLEMADRIAPEFDATFADAIRTELEARDVTVETGTSVERADDAEVTLADGRTIPHDVFVWTGGIRGPDALDGDRRHTEADLRVGDATFVVGDAGAVVDAAGERVPASAQTAVQEARTAAANIQRIVNAAHVSDPSSEDEPVTFREYRYEAAGWVVSVGDGAVAMVGPAVVSGDVAKAVKAAIGAGHLGSVGAIERASRLVHEELGWPGTESVDLSPLAGALERYTPTTGTDPSSPGAFERQFVDGLTILADLVGADDTVDLTGYTRMADRDHPGSPANLFARAAFAPADAAADIARTGFGDGSDADAGAGEEADVGDAGEAGDDGGAGGDAGVDADAEADGDAAGSDATDSDGDRPVEES